jgi:hypothetical protein
MPEIATNPAPSAPVAPAPPGAPAAPAPSPAQSQPGVISDAAYDALPSSADRDRFVVKKAGDQGGSEWVERAKLPSEAPDPAAKLGDPAKPGSTPEPTVTADGKLRVGDCELPRDDIVLLSIPFERGRILVRPGRARRQLWRFEQHGRLDRSDWSLGA